jgi:hypothetical protein
MLWNNFVCFMSDTLFCLFGIFLTIRGCLQQVGALTIEPTTPHPDKIALHRILQGATLRSNPIALKLQLAKILVSTRETCRPELSPLFQTGVPESGSG